MDPVSATLLGFNIFKTVGGVVGANNQAKIATAKASFQTSQIELAQAREETQAAIEASERERQLRSTLGRQRAMFAGAGIELSGTADTLAGASIGTLNRDQRFADLESGLTISQLNVEKSQVAATRSAEVGAARARRTGALFSYFTTNLSNAGIGSKNVNTDG